MKTTIDIPQDTLLDAMRFARAKTKRAAVMTALTDFNARRHMAALARHLGTCKALMTPQELMKLRKAE